MSSHTNQNLGLSDLALTDNAKVISKYSLSTFFEKLNTMIQVFDT